MPAFRTGRTGAAAVELGAGAGVCFIFCTEGRVNKPLYIWTRGLAQQFREYSLQGHVPTDIQALGALGEVCSHSSRFYG